MSSWVCVSPINQLIYYLPMKSTSSAFSYLTCTKHHEWSNIYSREVSKDFGVRSRLKWMNNVGCELRSSWCLSQYAWPFHCAASFLPSVTLDIMWTQCSCCWIVCALAMIAVTRKPQISRQTFPAHKSVDSNGSAWLCSMTQAQGNPSPSLLGTAVLTAENQNAKGWV